MKIEVENIPFNEYISSLKRAEYEFYLRWGNFKPEDYFKFGDFMNLDFGTVKDFQFWLNGEGLSWMKFIEMVSEIKGLDLLKVSSTPVFNLHQSRLYVLEEIEKINKLENDYLSYKTSYNEDVAGLSDFSEYGSFPQFDLLTGGDILKIKEIEKMPYDVCFTKLKYEHDKNAYQYNINKINERKYG